MKQLVMALILCSFSLHADWITDLSKIIEGDILENAKAVAIVQKYVDQDEAALKMLTAKIVLKDKDKDDEGFWATVRGGTYKVELMTAQGTLRYHKKVLDFVQSLPKNQREEKNLIEQLIKIRDLESEQALLREQYLQATGFSQSFKVGAQIAAKELLIKARRAYLKTTFLL